jgi:membrane-bound ClpP family serine protease
MRKILLLILSLLSLNLLFAQDLTLLNYKFSIKEDKTPSIWRQTKKIIAEMNYPQADIILINKSIHKKTEINGDSIQPKIMGHKSVLIDRIIGLFKSPIVSGILIIALSCGIYFEIQLPGMRIPLIVAVFATIGYFVPLYMIGLAENWEIALFIVGLVLLAIDIFVIPGSGITGTLSVSFIIIGLTLSLLNNVGFHFENVQCRTFLIALITVSISIITGFFLSLWIRKKLFTIKS